MKDTSNRPYVPPPDHPCFCDDCGADMSSIAQIRKVVGELRNVRETWDLENHELSEIEDEEERLLQKLYTLTK